MHLHPLIKLDNNNETSTTNEALNYVVNAFSMYPKVLHIDNGTYCNAIMSQKFFAHGTIQIINYDLNENPTRPPNIGSKCLHFICLANITQYSAYLSNEKNSNPSDLYILIVSQESIRKGGYFHLAYIERVQVFTILNIIHSKWEFFTVCYECGEKSGRLDFIDASYANDESKTDIQFWHEQYNLAGQHFKVSFIDSFPYIFCDTMHKNNTNCIGVYYEMIKSLGENMNFTYTLIRMNSYETLFELLNTEQIDFAVGAFALTEDRLKKVPFAKIFYWDDILVAYFESNVFTDIAKAYFRILPTKFWLAIIGSLLICAFGFYIVAKFRVKEKISYSFSLHVRFLQYQK